MAKKTSLQGLKLEIHKHATRHEILPWEGYKQMKDGTAAVAKSSNSLAGVAKTPPRFFCKD